MALSLVAVFVAGISTFAWFQLTLDTESLTGPSVTAGSPDISIQSVDGYKYRYAEISDGEYDYDDGAAAKYNAYSNGDSPANKTNNVHEDDTTNNLHFDVPDQKGQGTGYYVITGQLENSEMVYKYSNTTVQKMNGDSQQSTSAFLGKAYLTSGEKIRIRRHYYGENSQNETVTKDEFVSYTLASTSDATKTAGSNSDPISITNTGTYNISLSSGTVTLTKLSSSRYYRGTAGSGPTKKNASSASNQICVHVIDNNSGQANTPKAGFTWWNSNTDYSDFFLRAFGSDTRALSLDSNFVFNSVSAANNGGAFWSSNDAAKSQSKMEYADGAITFHGNYEVFDRASDHIKFRSYKFYFPWWITGCTFQIYRVRISGNSRYEEWCNTKVYPSTQQYYEKWFVQGDEWYLSGDTTASQSYSADAYTMSFNSNGGSSVSSSIFKQWQKTSAPTEPTKSGYNFSRWTQTDSASASAFTFGNALNGDITLYAQWNPGTFRVTLDSNRQGNGGSDGTTYVDATYLSAMPSTFTNAPTRTGYTFLGYFDSIDSSGTKYYNANRTSAHTWDKTSNTTLYAHWELNNSSNYTQIKVLDDLWTNGTLCIYGWSSGYSGNGSGFNYHMPISTKLSGYNNVYTFNVPNAANGGFILYKGTLGTLPSSNLTLDASLSGNDSYSTAKGTNDVYLIETDTQSSDSKTKNKWRWGTLPSALSDGYHMVYTDGTKEAMRSFGIDGGDKATLLQKEATAAATFTIWKKTTVSSNADFKHYPRASFAAAGVYDVRVSSSDTVSVSDGSIVTLVIKHVDGSPDSTYPMPSADNVHNRYAVESGVNVSAGDTFYLIYRNGTKFQYIGTWSTNDSGKTDVGRLVIDNTSLLEDGSSIAPGGGSSIVPFKFKASGSYTFYWTNGSPNNKMSVAPVPTLGFGHYVLLDPLMGFAGRLVKMKAVSGGDYKAYYASFYATAGQTIAFRSYFSSVDTYYKNSSITKNGLATNAASGDTEHAVTITTAGYYNFYIDNNDGVSITSGATANDFFTMNPVSPHATDVESQNTSFVLAIRFRTSNLQECNLHLDVTRTNTTNIKVGFFASATPLADPYEGMREKYSLLNTNSTMMAADFATDANNSTKDYYAYILIDYASKTASKLVESGSVSFFIRTRQVRPS